MAHNSTRAKTVSPGDELGGHRLTRKIGEGGMGAVYLAEHLLMGRAAAIKVLLPLYSDEPELTGRFFNEARAATAIRHPGIVEVYDFGHQPDGTAYIVMELLDGESVKARNRRVGRWTVDATLRAARQIASALAAAHAKGIVHRDLKPDNLFVVPDRDMPSGERFKVLDFGIAKLTDSDIAVASVKTRTGVVMGTPKYMAPEQCKSAGDVDHRADLYSLGCIMFEMLTARAPFVGTGAGEIIAKHIYGPPPSAAALNPAVPAAVDALVQQLLAKAPDQRHASAEALIAVLDRLLVATAAMPTESAGHKTIAAPSGSIQALAQPQNDPQTTLGFASGATLTSAEPSRKRKSLLLGGVLIVLLAAGAGAVMLGTGARSGSTAPVAAAGPADAPPAPNVPPAPKVPPPVVATDIPEKIASPPKNHATAAPVQPSISIRIESRPPGATVFRQPQGVRVGKTPYTHTGPPQDAAVTFTLRKPGYTNQTVTVSARTNTTKTVSLARATARAKQPPTNTKTRQPTKGKPRSTGTVNTTHLDPFDIK